MIFVREKVIDEWELQKEQGTKAIAGSNSNSKVASNSRPWMIDSMVFCDGLVYIIVMKSVLESNKEDL
jgi:hypothetical protein